jgi:hypothetical protein
MRVSRDSPSPPRGHYGDITTSLRLTLWWATLVLIPLVLPVVFITLAELGWKSLVKEVRIRGK